MQLLKYTVAFFIVFNLVYATVIGGEPGVRMKILGITDENPRLDMLQSQYRQKGLWKPNMGRAKLPYPRNYLFN